MILFPYRAQIKLHKLPVVTIAVTVVCLLVYAAQSQNERQVEAHAERVCAKLGTGEDGNRAEGHRWGRWSLSCEDVVLHIHFDPKPLTHLEWHAEDLSAHGDREGAERLRAQYHTFAERAPSLLTASLWHDRSRFDPLGMITSSFAHADWEHVIFNLIFFFAVAAAVELVLGPVLFMGAIVILSLGIGMFDQMIAHWEQHSAPSLGLSGVVMGMLGLFVYFLPKAKIRFFFWFMLSVGTIGIPAWLVAAWYIGWDLLYQTTKVAGSTNFVAHLAGAALGLGIGLAFFRSKRHWAKELVLETVDLRDDEAWLSKLNGIMVAPALAGFAFLAGVFLLLLIFVFVKHFWVPMLLVAPALVAGLELYRHRRAGRPDRDRYALGVKALERREYQEALKHLTPLADKNDTRALFTLAQLHATAHGALRDEGRAAELYRRAAERGHAGAQYALGTFYSDGRGVQKNSPAAAEWYEKAAEAGLPEAANSLARLYENGLGIPADREKAIEWYYRAAVAFQKKGQREDAEAICRHLESVARGYPAVLGLLAKLKALISQASRLPR